MCIRLHVKYPVFLSDFNETNFLDRLYKNTQNFEFHDNLSCASRLFNVDGQT
jgi:hypothetical protein